MIPRLGEAIQTGRAYKRRPGAYAILERDGRLLLTHQAEPVPEFQLPGGGIDPGEQMIPALHREVLEETGWRASRFVRIGTFRRFTYMPEYDLWAEKICHIFLGFPALRLGEPSEPGHNAIWATPSDACSLVASEGDRQFLQKFYC